MTVQEIIDDFPTMTVSEIVDCWSSHNSNFFLAIPSIGDLDLSDQHMAVIGEGSESWANEDQFLAFVEAVNNELLSRNEG